MMCRSIICFCWIVSLAWSFAVSRDRGSVVKTNNESRSHRDKLKLLFEIDLATQHSRIHLEPKKEVKEIHSKQRKSRRDGPKKPIQRTNQTKRKPRPVLEYEQKVARMHNTKRSNPTISKKEHLKVLYEDESVVVLNKPSGILCVPDINRNPSLLDLVWEEYGGAGDNVEDPTNDKPSSMIAHRLDMDTSGLVCFGKKADVSNNLKSTFRERNVVKEYEALVCGHLPASFESGIIDLPLQRDLENPPFMRVSTPKAEEANLKLIEQLKRCGYKKQGRKKPKESTTKFRVVERVYHPKDASVPVTRLRLTPITGRTHQLRVHCAAIGFPIIGDAAYGLGGNASEFGGLKDAISMPVFHGKKCNINLGMERATSDLQQTLSSLHPPNVEPMCLHAALLRLKHPGTGEAVEWTAPVPF